jgi:hypothetical protein
MSFQFKAALVTPSLTSPKEYVLEQVRTCLFACYALINTRSLAYWDYLIGLSCQRSYKSIHTPWRVLFSLMSAHWRSEWFYSTTSRSGQIQNSALNVFSIRLHACRKLQYAMDWIYNSTGNTLLQIRKRFDLLHRYTSKECWDLICWCSLFVLLTYIF